MTNCNAKKLDQFYTKPELANSLIENHILPLIETHCAGKDVLFLEPSAGSGSFSDPCIERGFRTLALDIDPKKDTIQKADFLQWNYEKQEDEAVFIIGNPPFGKNSSLAVKFFNHSAKFADFICFILPKTFKKISIHNRLDLNFHLVDGFDLDRKSFLFQGQEYDVPCCFQVWERRASRRQVKKIDYNNPFFEFSDGEDFDLVVRRAGGRAGTVFRRHDSDHFSAASNYFLKVKEDYSVDYVSEKIESLGLHRFVDNTAGTRSLSKYEFMYALKGGDAEKEKKAN